MTEIFKGRYTAASDKPVVVFLIGMRINRFLAVDKWWPVAMAMPAMLKELSGRPDSGFLHSQFFFSARTTLALQYWRSFDDLLAYAHDRTGVHFPAWGRFNKAVGQSGAVGIWHETYKIEPGQFETLYGNMPLFGLAAATSQVPATGRLAVAKDRMSAA